MTELKFDQENNSILCAFSGKLDTNFTIEAEPKIETHFADSQHKSPGKSLMLIFDFKQVDFVTSSFIRICVKYSKRVGKENFSIIHTNPLIKKTFKIAGLDGELNVIS